MRLQSKRRSPLGLVVRGVAAAAIGTVAMDAAMYLQYRRGGGTQSAPAWEFSEGLDSWEKAPAPAHVGKRIVECVFQRELPASRARLMNNVMHWVYGTSSGVVLGIVAGSTRAPRPLLGALHGAGVWSSGYVVLGAMGLYKPIWQYPVPVLAKDLANHLVFGTSAGIAFALLEKV